MNGKVCSRLRSIAKTKAHSWKDTTIKGAKSAKIPDFLLGMISANILNIQDGIFYQRKLDPMSVGAIVKKMKRLFQFGSHRDKNEFFAVLENVINQAPNMLGMPNPSQ